MCQQYSVIIQHTYDVLRTSLEQRNFLQMSLEIHTCTITLEVKGALSRQQDSRYDKNTPLSRGDRKKFPDYIPEWRPSSLLETRLHIEEYRL